MCELSTFSFSGRLMMRVAIVPVFRREICVRTLPSCWDAIFADEELGRNLWAVQLRWAFSVRRTLFAQARHGEQISEADVHA